MTLVRSLVAAGVREFELTSFVSPRAVPALADATELVRALADIPNVHWPALVPNVRGAERAPEAGNNAAAGGALIPMLSLGIPGSDTTAILLALLLSMNITPGRYCWNSSPAWCGDWWRRCSSATSCCWC